MELREVHFNSNVTKANDTYILPMMESMSHTLGGCSKLERINFQLLERLEAATTEN